MKIDPRELVGRPFDSIGYAAEEYFENFRGWHADEGLEPDWTVELRDGSMEFLLTKKRTVTTVFIHAEQLIAQIIGLPAREATIGDILQKLGQSTKFGPETDSPPLGPKGPWLRYDNPHQVTHLEFNIGGVGIHMLTLMAPEHAP